MSVELGNARLLQLAEVLETADERHMERGEPTYDQGKFGHHCGTPSCALGHWAAANPDRWFFGQLPSAFGGFIGLRVYIKANPAMRVLMAAREEFSLSGMEEVELFGLTGCGHAISAKQAAKYIREFVAKRQS